MSNNNQAPRTPRKKSILNDWRMPHPATEQPMAGGKYPAQLMWEIKNNGKIVLKVNDGVFKQDGANKHKEVELDAYDRGILFEGLLEATQNPDFKTKQIDVRSKQFVFQGGAGRMSDQPISQVKLTISRDEKGVMSLGYSKGDYKARFIFKGPRDSVLMFRNGDETTEDNGTMSRWATRNWVNFHRPILDRMEVEGWEPPKPRDGGNNPGGGSRGGSGPSNNDDFDEDVDF